MSASPSFQPRPPRLLNRYELLDEMPHVTGGRLFRARDLAFAEIVGLKQFGPGCNLPPESRQQLEDSIRHLQCLPHPHLVRPYSFDVSSGMLVQEWVQGISLLDVLRRRRELPLQAAAQILAPLPATLDFLAKEAVPAPRPLLGKIFIQFEKPSDAENFPTMPIDQWPPFTLKLNALSIRGLIGRASTDDTTTHTVIADPRHPSEISESYGPREFARLLYELLGGRIRELDSRRYIPIGALQEGGNAVLRRTLLAMPHTDCQSLWRDLLEAQPELTRAPRQAPAHSVRNHRPLRIPEPLLSRAQPGVGLRLMPTNRQGTPIRLVARSQFLIGRSAQQADFITRILPVNEANELLTNRLSRVHTILSVTPEGFEARDGNGRGPSLNGSYLDGQPLMPEPAAPLSHRSMLWLGKEYGIELIPVLQTAPRTLPISNLEVWSGPKSGPKDGPCGALVCLPVHGQQAVQHAAWIFTEVGFGLDEAEQLVWDVRGRASSPASFHFQYGCFWLSNRSLPEETLACDDTPLARDEIVPLVPGQTIRMGNQTFTVRLD